MSKKDIKRIYLTMKGKKELRNLSIEQKTFLKELQYQADVMCDFCKPLNRKDIASLIENCETEIQLENALRSRKTA